MSVLTQLEFQDRFSEALKRARVPYDKIAPSINVAIKLLEEANPQDPLPDNFFDLQKNTEIIARRIGKTKADVIRNFPDCVRDLFEGFDLLPENDDDDVHDVHDVHDVTSTQGKESRKKHLPRIKKIPFGISDIVDAGMAYFSKYGKRPCANSGPIKDGILAGKMSWSTFMLHSSLDPREGFSSVAEIMDFHAIGIRSVEKKMSSAFHSAFENAACYVSSSEQSLPYIFKVLEKSLAEAIAQAGTHSKSTTITTKPLAPLRLTFATIDDHFRVAAAKDGLFPYKSVYDFIDKRKIIDQARAAMQARAEDNGHHI